MLDDDVAAVRDVIETLAHAAESLDSAWRDCSRRDGDAKKLKTARKRLANKHAREVAKAVASIATTSVLNESHLGHVIQENLPDTIGEAKGLLALFSAIVESTYLPYDTSDDDNLGPRYSDVTRLVADKLEDLCDDYEREDDSPLFGPSSLSQKMAERRYSYYIGFTYRNRPELLCALANKLREEQAAMLVTAMRTRCELIEAGAYQFRSFRAGDKDSRQILLQEDEWASAIARVNATEDAFRGNRGATVTPDERRRYAMWLAVKGIVDRVWKGKLKAKDFEGEWTDSMGDFPMGRTPHDAEQTPQLSQRPGEAGSTEETPSEGSVVTTPATDENPLPDGWMRERYQFELDYKRNLGRELRPAEWKELRAAYVEKHPGDSAISNGEIEHKSFVNARQKAKRLRG